MEAKRRTLFLKDARGTTQQQQQPEHDREIRLRIETPPKGALAPDALHGSTGNLCLACVCAETRGTCSRARVSVPLTDELAFACAWQHARNP
ncbi:unnamed protein product [Lampetra fluviatilis]